MTALITYSLNKDQLFCIGIFWNSHDDYLSIKRGNQIPNIEILFAEWRLANDLKVFNQVDQNFKQSVYANSWDNSWDWKKPKSGQIPFRIWKATQRKFPMNGSSTDHSLFKWNGSCRLNARRLNSERDRWYSSVMLVHHAILFFKFWKNKRNDLRRTKIGKRLKMMSKRTSYTWSVRSQSGMTSGHSQYQSMQKQIHRRANRFGPLMAVKKYHCL